MVNSNGSNFTAALVQNNPHMLHPRLYARNEDFERIIKEINKGSCMADWYEPYKSVADYTLTLPPYEYEIRDDIRLLHVAQDITQRIYALCLAYKIEKDNVYAQRAYTELEAIANYRDWNPSHFLDVAQMTYAVTLCYDWIYDYMTPKQRHLVRDALVKHSLDAYYKAYEDFASGRELQAGKDLGTWSRSVGNWNFWCNGAAISLAIVLGDEEPQMISFIFENAISSLQLALDIYAPDGGFAEGLGYGMAANNFWARMTWSLIKATGDDFGLSGAQGMSDFSSFVTYMNGPVSCFNFHDVGGNAKQHYESAFFVAMQKNLPDLVRFRLKAISNGEANADLFDILWYKPTDTNAGKNDLPLDRYFRKVETGSMRSSWDSDALWLAFHGGQTDVAHTHLDSGSFVFDAMGENWALDLGTEPLTYFGTREQVGGNHFLLYRISAAGHNTVLINPSKSEETQAIPSFCPVIEFDSNPESAYAIMNLAPAYTTQAEGDVWDLHARMEGKPRKYYQTKVKEFLRGFSLGCERSRIIVQDEVSLVAPSDYWWSMHTRADIELSPDGKVATLSQHGKKIKAFVCSGNSVNISFSVMPATMPPGGPINEYEAANDGVNKLAVHIENAKEVKMRVEFVCVNAENENQNLSHGYVPLSQWK